MNEFIPRNWQNVATTFLNCGDASVMIFQTVYYIFWKNWVYIHIIGIAGAILIILIILTIPESPKFYYANKRFNETRKVLKFVGKWNKR